ncbi:S-adenosylmethionine decarboxylase proenzyme-like [Actinia tenebrosa]|uniref:S-adenosylmethionine decarboxylase proenzyme n=1 Tax=Actinia tenebrosa TaxID=6105 RepID=A0A6P8IGH4_ACTTE|nr:S-adenosylmethionine decarboxylase proenzyme-like [Actinia tenebrosa]
MCEVGFFEGPEKLMEVWWKCLPPDQTKVLDNTKSGDLRTISREKWERILELVNCQIISVTKNEEMTAYLLSESSMFVSKTRVILKTCGQTTLLYSIKPMMSMVKEECGLTEIQDFFYSRMSFLEPKLQHAPHQSFDQEAQWLDKLFPNGAAYALGRINGRGCWYLYTLNSGVDEPDQTLEILMQDLDPDIMKEFYKNESSDVKHVTKISGIKDFIPEALIDDALFDPCGYSMNGLINESYFTIHITPQKECSYVSFETNFKLVCYKDLINKVLCAFKPAKFLMTLFANKDAPCSPSIKTFENIITGYKREDFQLCKMKEYNLSYGHFKKDTTSPIS